MNVFVDNELVYARDSRQHDKQVRAAGWIAHLWATKAGHLSAQVLNEFYVTVTRKLSPGMTTAAARAEIRDLMTWRVAPVTAELIDEAWSVEDRYGLSHWDSTIVAGAGLMSCDVLLTEDLQDGQWLGRVRVLDPFATPPPT